MWLGTKIGQAYAEEIAGTVGDWWYGDGANVHLTGPEPESEPEVKVDVLDQDELEEIEATVAQQSPTQGGALPPAILTILNLAPPLPDIYVRRTSLPRTDFPSELTLLSITETPAAGDSTLIGLELQNTSTSNMIGRFLLNIDFFDAAGRLLETKAATSGQYILEPGEVDFSGLQYFGEYSRFTVRLIGGPPGDRSSQQSRSTSSDQIGDFCW